MHDRFLSLTERVTQIPILKERIAQQELEREGIAKNLQALQNSAAELGFSQIEYNSLYEERRSLASAEDESHRISLMIAAEPEMKRSLAEALEALDDLEKDLQKNKEILRSLAYDPNEYETSRLMLTEAEDKLELAHKEVFEKKVQIGILKVRP